MLVFVKHFSFKTVVVNHSNMFIQLIAILIIHLIFIVNLNQRKCQTTLNFLVLDQKLSEHSNLAMIFPHFNKVHRYNFK